MDLSEKKLQELKNRKISIEELNDEYLINSQHEIEVENISKLLNSNIYNFKEVVDRFKSMEDADNDPCLYRLLDEELFKKLIENNLLNKEDTRYLLNKLDKSYELHNLSENTTLLKHIVDNELFKELIDKFKTIKDYVNNPCLKYLLDNKELFEELIKNNKLNKEDLKYLLNRLDRSVELYTLYENTILLKYSVDKGLFKELVNTFKSTKDVRNDSSLYVLLQNEELFENNKLNTEDLRYLLNQTDNIHELDKLCDNTSLIKDILNDFILDKENVDKFNTLIENDEGCKNRNIHTVFESIEYNENNEEVLKLNELNKKVYLLTNFDLNEDQRLEIHEILRNNEIARNRLIQIVDNNLQDQYIFEQLKNILTKDVEKKKIKMNF